MSSNPLISVIIPAYNAAAYLDAALASVAAQTHRPLEIIVVDDGSTDATAKVAQTFPEAQYAYQTHAGISAALNHGIALATGDYFSFLDADDLWIANKLTRQLEYFARDATLDMVFGHIQQFQVDDVTHALALSPPSEGYFKGTLLIPRAAFFRVGLFDTQWQIGDFIDWYLRARALRLKSAMLPEVLMQRRIHTQNMGIREREQRGAYLRILKRALEKRQPNDPIR